MVVALVSAYLNREISSIHHLCDWCLSSLGIVFLLMWLSVWRFLRGEQPPREAPPPCEPDAPDAAPSRRGPSGQPRS